MTAGAIGFDHWFLIVTGQAWSPTVGHVGRHRLGRMLSRRERRAFRRARRSQLLADWGWR